MMGRPEKTYLSLGLLALVLLAVAYVLQRGSTTMGMVLVYLVSAGVVVVWAVQGIVAARRQARAAAEKARLEAEKAQREAEEAARQAAELAAWRERMSKRTSLGGTTIRVHRRSE